MVVSPDIHYSRIISKPWMTNWLKVNLLMYDKDNLYSLSSIEKDIIYKR